MHSPASPLPTGEVEEIRLRDAGTGAAAWKKWGPYLSERQWGTVREDYSETGDAWGYFPHDQARSRATRDVLGGLGREAREKNPGDAAHGRLPQRGIGRAIADGRETQEAHGGHLRRAQQREAVRQHAGLVGDDVPEHEVVDRLVDRARGRQDRERQDGRLYRAGASELPAHGR